MYRQIAYKQYPAGQTSGGHDLIMLLDVPHPVPDVPYSRFSGSTCKHTSSLGCSDKAPCPEGASILPGAAYSIIFIVLHLENKDIKR